MNTNTNTNDGGPAFPISDPFSVKGPGTESEALRLRNGMTLRDYFAAKAMGALIVDPDRADQSREECARLSYAMADAMLAARAKSKPADPARDAAPELLNLAFEFEAFAEAAMNDAIEEGDALLEETWRVRRDNARAAIAKATGKENTNG